jgi:molecular chaperone DnaK
LRSSLGSKARVLRAAESAKKRLSSEAVTTIEEEFIGEKAGRPLNLRMEIDRPEYEELIRPLLLKTLTHLDQAMSDAKLQATQVDKVVLVGGATRTPLVHQLLEERLGRPVHSEIEPDLAVALGASVQGGLISGIDVGPVLVDITPHTLGIEALGELYGFLSSNHFAPIIERNTPLPASRTEIFTTSVDQQEAARIRVFQGENPDTRHNTLVGEFLIEGLAEVPAGNQILVRLDLDLNGILKVTATERATGLAKHIVIDNAMERFRTRQRTDAVDRLETVFGTVAAPQPGEPLALPSAEGPAAPTAAAPAEDLAPSLRQAIESAVALIAKAERVRPSANEEDATELGALTAELRGAIGRRSEDDIRAAMRQLEDLVFYLEDAS